MTQADSYLSNEADLFAGLSHGSIIAFEQIYHHYNKQISHFVFKMLRAEEPTEEIVQDIFIRLWINRKLLAEVKNPRAYLYSMAANKTYDYLKTIAVKNKHMAIVAAEKTEISTETEERIIFNESSRLISALVEQLPQQRKIIYKLSREEGLSHEQIAEKLQISRNTVKNQLVHALKTLRTELNKNGDLLGISVLIMLTHK